MKIPTINSWGKAKCYLEMLAQTVKDDIHPLLATKGGAPHTISREVFSYVDYLGALYVGTSNVKCDGRDGLAVVGIRFKRYLDEVMCKSDTGYKQYSEVVYQMYRNGPVHNFEPKNLTNRKKQVLKWMEYQGLRKANKLTIKIGDKEFTIKVEHLLPCKAPDRQKVYYLPVSTNCLIEDLLHSIEDFKSGLGKPGECMTHWNETARILNRLKEVDFNVP